MNCKRFHPLPILSRKTVAILLLSLTGIPGFGLVFSSTAEANPHERQVNSPRTPGVATPTDAARTTVPVDGLHVLLAQARLIHPLVLAMGQILLVVGVCLLLTDNRELELYFRIEFEPPKTDILN